MVMLMMKRRHMLHAYSVVKNLFLLMVGVRILHYEFGSSFCL